MDLNTVLRGQGAPITGSDSRAGVANTNANGSWTPIVVPGGAIGVYLDRAEATLASVVFLAAGAATPSKASNPDGALGFTGGGGPFFFGLDASDPPSMFVRTNDGADALFDAHFVAGTK